MAPVALAAARGLLRQGKKVPQLQECPDGAGEAEGLSEPSSSSSSSCILELEQG